MKIFLDNSLCLLLVTVILFTNCTLNKSSEFIDENSSDKKVLQEPTDKDKVVDAVGCIEGFFGLIDHNLVLKLPTDIYRPRIIELNEKQKPTIYNTDENGLRCELQIFEKDSAHLANICTDIQMVNYPKKIRTLRSIDGKLSVVHEKINDELYIHIEKITFIDSLNQNRIIEIKEKIFWKTPYLGIPG